MRDGVLVHLVRRVNETREPVAISLLVGGQVVTGVVVSVAAYDEMHQHTAVQAARASFTQMIADYDEDDARRHAAHEATGPYFVHLRDIEVGGVLVPGLWKLDIEQVAAWALVGA